MTKIEEIKLTFENDLAACESSGQLQDLKVKYIGKSGVLTSLLKGIKDLPAEERPSFGAKVNELRNLFEKEIGDKSAEVKSSEMQRRIADEKVDISLCEMKPWGALHPVTTFRR